MPMSVRVNFSWITVFKNAQVHKRLKCWMNTWTHTQTCSIPVGCRGGSCRTSSDSHRSSGGSCGKGCYGSSPELPTVGERIIHSKCGLWNLQCVCPHVAGRAITDGTSDEYGVSLELNLVKLCWRALTKNTIEFHRHIASLLALLRRVGNCLHSHVESDWSLVVFYSLLFLKAWIIEKDRFQSAEKIW